MAMRCEVKIHGFSHEALISCERSCTLSFPMLVSHCFSNEINATIRSACPVPLALTTVRPSEYAITSETFPAVDGVDRGRPIVDSIINHHFLLITLCLLTNEVHFLFSSFLVLF